MGNRSVVAVKIRFNSPAGVVMKRGTFPLRGKAHEQVALEWWKQIQREVFTGELLEVLVDGEDITKKIKKSPLK